jgi:hypothetical protein
VPDNPAANDQPQPIPSVPDNPSSAPAAIMIGKIDVSHFAGLKAGDTVAQVVSLYGPEVGHMSGSNGTQSFGGPQAGLLVTYNDDSRVDFVVLQPVALEFARSRVGDDPLFELFGHPEADAVAVLGAPTAHYSRENGDLLLSWSFPSVVREDHRNGSLELIFKPGYGCDWIRLNW